MSLSLIIGEPRQGKTNFVTTKMIEELCKTDRDVYTNISIHPDQMAKLVCIKRYRHKGNLFYLENLPLILSRLHVFRTFSSREEWLEFKKKNPLYVQLHLRRDRRYDNQKKYCQKLIFPYVNIREFYNYCRTNALHMYDETYQIWNAQDSTERDTNSKERRKRLQTYSMHNGHYDDDIYLITHDEKLIDSYILPSVMSRYICRNMMYYPVIPEIFIDKYPILLGWLASLKWPFMIFQISHLVGKSQTVMSTDWLVPKMSIFKCYDTKSAADSLGKEITHNKNKGESSDSNLNHWRILRDWLKCSWGTILCLIIFLYMLYMFFHVLINTTFSGNAQPVTSGVSSPGPVSSDSSDQSKKSSSAPGAKEIKPKTISAISPNSIYFSDGTYLKKGQSYEIKGRLLLVVAVRPDYVEFELPGGKSIKVSTALLLRMQ